MSTDFFVLLRYDCVQSVRTFYFEGQFYYQKGDFC